MYAESMDKIRYVSSFLDRDGVRRFRFRKTGLATHYFASAPGTPEFEADYQACLEGRTPKQRRRRVRKKWRIRPLTTQAREAMAKHPEAESYVYFVGPRSGPVKIGLAIKPARRLKEIQIGNHVRLDLLALIPGGSDVEARYHRELAKYRLWGEWFDRVPEVMAAVAQAKSLASAPAPNLASA